MPSLLLRPWQRRALDALAVHPHPDFLAVATPGAGKTTFALVALTRELHDHPGPAIVVAPTAHLKIQWASNAARLGLHLDPSWAPGSPFGADMHGIVTTYQQVASAAADLAGRVSDGVVILDEVHHAGDDKAWGDSVAVAFRPARRRISLSGTPFRSDTQAIPFVRYDFDEACPDVEYGYGDALEDGVVRPVYFPRIDGEMEWVSADGTHHQASFTDELDRTLMAQRLRTALSVDGEWLPTVLTRANSALMRMRRTHPHAGGLVIATDTEHASAISRLLRERCGVNAIVTTSEDPEASSKIAAFSESTDPWIVAVRMVSEGVDIPRLRVGVWATTTATELFFRQAVGRLVRVTQDTRGARSIMYLPDDPRLRAHSMGIAESRRHVLKKAEDADEVDPLEDPMPGLLAEDAEQMSLFQAVAATPTTDTSQPEWFDDEPFPSTPGADGHEGEPLQLFPPPTPSGAVLHVADGPGPAPARHITKAQLRQRNADLVRVLVRRAGMDHKAVNLELNRLSGVRRIADATAGQLEARLQAGEKWLSKL